MSTFEIKARQINTACGMWKFKKHRVSVELLVTLAYEWNKRSEGRYTHLMVRDCSKDQHGIQFSYPLAPGESYDEFFDEKTDALKRQFGNDFVGYDVSSSAYVIL